MATTAAVETVYPHITDRVGRTPKELFLKPLEASVWVHILEWIEVERIGKMI